MSPYRSPQVQNSIVLNKKSVETVKLYCPSGSTKTQVQVKQQSHAI